MGTSGCVLSCLALNDCAVQGGRLLVHLPGIEDSRASRPGSRACAELGYKDEL
jgi:hypothetical protein